MAQIARYHRKSHPARSHQPFTALDPADQRRVKILAGILRIAIGLDRRHRNVVASMRVLVSDDIIIEPVAGGSDQDLSIEVHAATERVSLLSDALQQEVRISLPSVLAPAPS